MADTKESTKARSRAVTSREKASRQSYHAELSISDGVILPTDEKAEKTIEMLARLLDVTHNWIHRMPDGGMPLPLTKDDFIILAFPTGGHVIKNAVTSDGRQNFTVDGVSVIPVTSEKGK